VWYGDAICIVGLCGSDVKQGLQNASGLLHESVSVVDKMLISSKELGTVMERSPRSLLLFSNTRSNVCERTLVSFMTLYPSDEI
jgi:hypothetical protein